MNSKYIQLNSLMFTQHYVDFYHSVINLIIRVQMRQNSTIATSKRVAHKLLEEIEITGISTPRKVTFAWLSLNESKRVEQLK